MKKRFIKYPERGERGVIKIPGHEGLYYSITPAAKRMAISSQTLRNILRRKWDKYYNTLKDNGMEVEPDSFFVTDSGYHYLSSDLVEKLVWVYYQPVRTRAQ